MITFRNLRRIGLTLSLATLVGLGVSLFKPGLALATRETLLAKQLLLIAGAELNGFSCRPSRVVYLEGGEAYHLSTTLFRNVSYELIGLGDETVRDLDLELYDEDWNLISRDTSEDNLPDVKVTPRWTGPFHYKIVMYSGHGLATAMICYRN